MLWLAAWVWVGMKGMGMPAKGIPIVVVTSREEHREWLCCRPWFMCGWRTAASVSVILEI